VKESVLAKETKLATSPTCTFLHTIFENVRDLIDSLECYL
jgi:hypothetical protein